MNLRLRQGQIYVRHQPVKNGQSKFVLALGDSTLHARTATVRVGYESSLLWIAVDEGSVEFLAPGNLKLTLGAGQVFVRGQEHPGVWRQLEAPYVLTETNGNWPGANILKWVPTAKAVAYRLEMSDSPQFERLVIEETTTKPEMNVAALNQREARYWRVMAIDERGIPGVHSPVFKIGKRQVPKKASPTDI